MLEQEPVEVSEFDIGVDQIKKRRQLEWRRKALQRPDPFGELEARERRARHMEFRVMSILSVCVVIAFLL